MRLLSRRVLICSVVGLVGAGTLAGSVVARQRAAAGMATAANNFVASLTPEQRQKAVFPMPAASCLQAATSECEWTKWHFIPASMNPRNGLPFKEMNQTQRQRAHDLMKASLSQVGYTTAASIMQLENVLREMEGPGRAAGAPAAAAPPAPPAAPPAAPAAGPDAARGGARRGGGAPGGAGGGGAPIVRDPELYYVSVFGEPSAKAGWGWRVEGHHVSLRFAVDGGKMSVTSTPQFLGSNPAQVPYGYGPYTDLRVLAVQEDTARALVLALNEKARKIALVAETPRGDIATATALKIDPLNPVGVPASEMTSAQRAMLVKIIETYANVMPADVAADRMAKMKSAGMEKITFAWAGSTEKGQRYHYQVQGPTFLIEHNNTQNNGNHVHSVWRDFSGDFGRDLLGEHMAAMPH